MEHSPHVMLAGRGADTFSRDHGLEQADADWFALPKRRAQPDALKASGGSAFDVDMKYGTVGAVARDAHGHVAAATRSEEHTSELQSHMRISYAVFCLQN